MKTPLKFLSFLLITIALSFGCAQRSDEGNDDTSPDAGTPDVDANDDAGTDLTVAPPAESTTWACRSGVDAEGVTYMEFRPGYLNGGTVETAYIVGEADDEGIYAYFHGAYVQRPKHAGSGWYRLDLSGPVGSVGVLTYASCEDEVGTNAACWAQYGGSLSAEAAGPYRYNSSGTNYACRFEIDAAGKPAKARGAN